MTEFTTPDKPYTQVKSEHIKKKIQNYNFDNLEERKEVNKLIFLERQITGEINLGYPGGLLYDKVKNNHQQDHKKIYRELRPQEFEKLQKEKKEKKQKLRKERQKRQKKREKKIEDAREEWRIVEA